MYKIEKEKITNIIDNSQFDNTDIEKNELLKSVLKKTIGALCDYNEKVLGTISKQVVNSHKYYIWEHIICALTSINEKELYIELSEMSDGEPIPKIYFIDADYDTIREIVGDKDTEKIYHGAYRINGQNFSFQYRFKFYDGYLKAQDLLYRLAAHYQINNSIIFSPFIRKSFQIIIIDDIPSDVNDEQIDYQFNANKIPIIEESMLMWNLDLIKTKVMSAIEKVPYGSQIKYKYQFDKSASGNWYYVLPQNNQTLIYDIQFTDIGTQICIDHELEDFILVECKTVEKERLEIKKLISKNRFFDNYVLKNNLSNKRIISEGDIEYAIRPFRFINSVKCEIVPELKKVTSRYSAKYRNHLSNRIGYKKLKQVYIKFTADDDIAYMDDYINYVLLYMEYYFPEIEWVGGM